MRSRSQYTGSILLNVHEFLERRPVAVAIGDLKLPIAEIDAAIKELNIHRTESESRRRMSVAATGRILDLARQARLQFMRPVARAAAWQFTDNPKLQAALKERKEVRRPEAIVDALRGMADAVEPHATDFLKAGFAEDFPARMRQMADSLEEAINARSRERGRRSGAAAGSLHRARDGRKLIRLVDALVSPSLEATPELLAEWKLLLRDNKPRVVPREVKAEAKTPDAPAA